MAREAWKYDQLLPSKSQTKAFPLDLFSCCRRPAAFEIGKAYMYTPSRINGTCTLDHPTEDEAWGERVPSPSIDSIHVGPHQDPTVQLHLHPQKLARMRVVLPFAIPCKNEDRRRTILQRSFLHVPSGRHSLAFIVFKEPFTAMCFQSNVKICACIA